MKNSKSDLLIMSPMYKIFVNNKETKYTVSSPTEQICVSDETVDAYHISEVVRFTLNDVRMGCFDNIVIDETNKTIACTVPIYEREFREKPVFIFNTFIRSFDKENEVHNFCLKSGSSIKRLNGNGEFVFKGNEMALPWTLRYNGCYDWEYVYRNNEIVVTDCEQSNRVQISRVDSDNNACVCEDAFAMRFYIPPVLSGGFESFPIEKQVDVCLKTSKGKFRHTITFAPSPIRCDMNEAFLIVPDDYAAFNVREISFVSRKYKYKKVKFNKDGIKQHVSVPLIIEKRCSLYSRFPVLWYLPLILLVLGVVTACFCYISDENRRLFNRNESLSDRYEKLSTRYESVVSYNSETLNKLNDIENLLDSIDYKRKHVDRPYKPYYHVAIDEIRRIIKR